MPAVKCSVSDCNYWAQGNLCSAETILIEIDKHANANLNEEFAGEGFEPNHKDTAKIASATCCHTFEPKKGA